MARKAPTKNRHAVALGRLGGKAGKGKPATAKKRRAVAKNGRLGGRPRKDGKPPIRRKRKRSIARRAATAAMARQAAGPATLDLPDRASSSEAGQTEPVVRRLVGWTVGDGSGHEGYAVETYFDANGKYLGPDKHGIEPIFDDEADNEPPDRASSSEEGQVASK